MTPLAGVPRNILIQHTLLVSALAISHARVLRERTVVERMASDLIIQPTAQVFQVVSSTTLAKDPLTRQFGIRVHGMGAGTKHRLRFIKNTSNPTQSKAAPLHAEGTFSLSRLYRITIASAEILTLLLNTGFPSPRVTFPALAIHLLPAVDQWHGMS
jgi:hypothetical protein